MPRDDAALLDVVRAAQLITDFVAGFDEKRFTADLKTQSAVLHQLLIMGEAAKRLSAEFRETHSDVPWRLITGMRDKLIHEYDEVDIPEVWNTVTRDVPRLLVAIGSVSPKS